jgi:sugar lactone lactonase YvrE
MARNALPLDTTPVSTASARRAPRQGHAGRGRAVRGQSRPRLLVLLGLGAVTAAGLILGGRGGLQPAVPPWALTFEATLGPVERPAGIAVGRDGTAYVVDSERARIMVFSPEGFLVRSLGLEGEQETPEVGQLNNPLGIALGPAGLVYVSDLGAGRITVFDGDGGVVGYFGAEALTSARARAGALAATEGGLLVCDLAQHRVLLLGWDGALQRVFAPPATDALSYPNGAWLAADGRLYVSDTNHDRVVTFSAEGGFLGPIAEGIVNPRGLVGDGQGRLYVASALAHSVVVLDLASGRQITALTGALGHGLGFPTAVALNGDRLLVTDRAAAGVHVWRIEGGGR